MAAKTDTRRDRIEINLDGPIKQAIAELAKLEAEYPDGEIELTSETEYGETYEKLYLNFTRPATAVELEYSKVSEQMRALASLRTSAAAFAQEGVSFPRQAELDALAKELGWFAKGSRMGSLTIMQGELVMYGFNGAYNRDGEWRLRTMMGGIEVPGDPPPPAWDSASDGNPKAGNEVPGEA